jgi:hypothetical protein
MSRVRIPPLSIALTCLILVAILAPVLVSMAGRSGDFVMHIRYALLWEQDGFWGKPLPHFLYQSLLVFFHNRFSGANSFAFASSFITLAANLAFGITLYILLYRALTSFRPRLRVIIALVLTIILTLVAPVTLLTWGRQNLYLGYIGIESFHNPTIILLKPLTLWLFLFALRVFQTQTSVRMVLSCATIAALSAITKPNYAICLLPALALYTLYTLYRKQPLDWRLLLVGIVTPTVTVIAWQWFFYRYQGIGGFAIAPFQVMSFYSPDLLLPKFVLSILFPLCVLIFYFKAAIGDLALRLSWLAFLFGVIYVYFFVETRAWQDGNFGWSGEITLLILFISTTLLLIRQYLADRGWTPKLIVCALALGLHFISGVIFYAIHLGNAWNSWY